MSTIETRKLLHLKTQRGQPYGSTRRSCEMCGIMIWPERQKEEEIPAWTDDPEFYNQSDNNCLRASLKI